MDKVLGCVFILAVVGVCTAIGGFIFMLLFNWLTPIFFINAPVLTFFQAWGVWFLLGIIAGLFKKYD